MAKLAAEYDKMTMQMMGICEKNESLSADLQASDVKWSHLEEIVIDKIRTLKEHTGEPPLETPDQNKAKHKRSKTIEHEDGEVLDGKAKKGQKVDSRRSL